MNTASRPIPPTLWPWLRALGYGGWLPFAALLWGALAQGEPWRAVLLAYSVAIVSFVGALSWGWALALPDLDDAWRRRLLVWSVVPCLLASVAAAMPSPWQWWALVGVYGLAWLMDWQHNRHTHWPPAWLRLRGQLSAGAIITMTTAALNTL
jgi:hypothetical protein